MYIFFRSQKERKIQNAARLPKALSVLRLSFSLSSLPWGAKWYLISSEPSSISLTLNIYVIRWIIRCYTISNISQSCSKGTSELVQRCLTTQFFSFSHASSRTHVARPLASRRQNSYPSNPSQYLRKVPCPMELSHVPGVIFSSGKAAISTELFRSSSIESPISIYLGSIIRAKGEGGLLRDFPKLLHCRLG